MFGVDLVIGAAENYWIDQLRSDCILESTSLYNWKYGRQPFANQLPLWTHSIGSAGAKNTVYGSQSPAAVGREVVGFIKFETGGAKPGRQFLRQLLDENDINAVAGDEWRFVPGGAGVTPATYHTHAMNRLSPFIGATAALPAFYVVHFSAKNWNQNPVAANAPFSTAVTDVQLIRPGTNKSTRKNKK
jgi:hypothetical protein